MIFVSANIPIYGWKFEALVMICLLKLADGIIRSNSHDHPPDHMLALMWLSLSAMLSVKSPLIYGFTEHHSSETIWLSTSHFIGECVGWDYGLYSVNYILNKH